jgi:hypothetical protein
MINNYYSFNAEIILSIEFNVFLDGPDNHLGF